MMMVVMVMMMGGEGEIDQVIVIVDRSMVLIGRDNNWGKLDRSNGWHGSTDRHVGEGIDRVIVIIRGRHVQRGCRVDESNAHPLINTPRPPAIPSHDTHR